MPRISPRLLSVVSLFAVTACHRSTVPTLEDFREAYGQLECEHSARDGWIGRSEIADCKARSLVIAQGRRDRRMEDLQAGRLVYDSGAAQDCIDFMRSASSDVGWISGPRPCEPSNYLRGNLPEGQPCGGVLDVCKDSVCVPAVGATCGRGTCTAFTPIGGACPDLDLCPPKATCEIAARACVETGSGLGAPCRAGYTACDEGLYCRGNVCGPIPKIGEPCAEGICAPNATCDEQASPPTCRGRLDDREECTFEDACKQGLACIGLLAGATPGKCGNWLDLGDRCEPSGVSGCPKDAECNPATLTCEKLAASVGSKCLEAACGVPTLYCDRTTDTCQPKKPLGDDCAYDGQCDSGYCDSQCKVALPSGSPCSTFGACDTSWCDSSSMTCC